MSLLQCEKGKTNGEMDLAREDWKTSQVVDYPLDSEDVNDDIYYCFCVVVAVRHALNRRCRMLAFIAMLVIAFCLIRFLVKSFITLVFLMLMLATLGFLVTMCG